MSAFKRIVVGAHRVIPQPATKPVKPPTLGLKLVHRDRTTALYETRSGGHFVFGVDLTTRSTEAGPVWMWQENRRGRWDYHQDTAVFVTKAACLANLQQHLGGK